MLASIQQKIQSFDALRSTLEAWRTAGQRIVFTNGCFDVIHYGHIAYLAEAKSLGDRLVIGLNSSASVARLKGPHRPLQDERSRATVLAAFQFTDAVVRFKEDTPLKLIQLIRPDVLVKGGDYRIDTIVGAKEVLAQGGMVKVLSFVQGYSTSAIEQRIREGRGA